MNGLLGKMEECEGEDRMCKAVIIVPENHRRQKCVHVHVDVESLG